MENASEGYIPPAVVKKTNWFKVFLIIFVVALVIYIGYYYFGLPPQLQQFINNTVGFNPNTGSMSIVCKYILEKQLSWYQMIDGKTRCFINPFKAEFPMYDCLCYTAG